MRSFILVWNCILNFIAGHLGDVAFCDPDFAVATKLCYFEIIFMYSISYCLNSRYSPANKPVDRIPSTSLLFCYTTTKHHLFELANHICRKRSSILLFHNKTLSIAFYYVSRHYGCRIRHLRGSVAINNHEDHFVGFDAS